ncbi:MAG: hypothetical protein F8N37_15345 [Telmatospirillum sp.]|nr:hypothetical protein [Telmatospirillum sp.]
MKKVERVQTGVRIEKRLLKILKSLAAYQEMSVSDLLEGILLHSLEGKVPFGPETLAIIETLRTSYGLDLRADDSHSLLEHRTDDA